MDIYRENRALCLECDKHYPVPQTQFDDVKKLWQQFGFGQDAQQSRRKNLDPKQLRIEATKMLHSVQNVHLMQLRLSIGEKCDIDNILKTVEYYCDRSMHGVVQFVARLESLKQLGDDMQLQDG